MFRSSISFCRKNFLLKKFKNFEQLNYFSIKSLASTSKSNLNFIENNQNDSLENYSSINLNEIKKFRKLSKKWWNGNEFQALRNMNQLRIPFIIQSFHSNFYDDYIIVDKNKNNDDLKAFQMDPTLPLKNLKLLDIGCGGGILAESLARLGANIIGIDPIEQNILAAENHLKLTFQNNDTNDISIDYQCTTIEKFYSIESNQNKFDGVIASEVLEHVDDIATFLKSSLGCLRPNGFYFITTINQTLPSLFGAIVLAENVLGLVPKGTHQYEKFIPPAALKLILEEDYNCSVRKILGMGFNPLTDQWQWIDNHLINYAMVAQKHPDDNDDNNQQQKN